MLPSPVFSNFIFVSKVFEIQTFIAIFGISMQNANEYKYAKYWSRSSWLRQVQSIFENVNFRK